MKTRPDGPWWSECPTCKGRGSTPLRDFLALPMSDHTECLSCKATGWVQGATVARAVVNDAVQRLGLIRKGTRSEHGNDSHYLMLYALVRAYRPRIIVEAGVLAGCSAIYMGQALKDNFEIHGVKGHLYGFDIWNIEGYDLDTTRGYIREAGLKDWVTVETRDSAKGIGTLRMSGDTNLPTGGQLIDFPFIDFAFIDGDHRKHGVRADYEAVKTWASDRCVIVFHDLYEDCVRDVAKRAAMDGFSEQLQVPAWCELLVCRKPFYWREHGRNHPSEVDMPLGWPEHYRHLDAVGATDETHRDHYVENVLRGETAVRGDELRAAYDAGVGRGRGAGG